MYIEKNTNIFNESTSQQCFSPHQPQLAEQNQYQISFIESNIKYS